MNFKLKLTLNQGEFAPRSKLPREIWRWLLGFSLKGKTKNVRRDFSNGYVIAEVLHQYFPMDIQLPEFRNGESFPIKMAKPGTFCRNFLYFFHNLPNYNQNLDKNLNFSPFLHKYIFTISMN